MFAATVMDGRTVARGQGPPHCGGGGWCCLPGGTGNVGDALVYHARRPGTQHSVPHGMAPPAVPDPGSPSP